MMDFPKYDSYKNSGIEWLGEIPRHWEVIKFKFLLNEPLKYGANEEATEQNYNDPRYIRITDFEENGQLKHETFRSLPFHKAKDYWLKVGDILFARSGATVGKTFFFDDNYKGNACYAGYLIKASPNYSLILPKYLYLYTKSKYFEYWKEIILSKSTIQNISADKYNSLPIVIPSLKEQKRIVQFLDRKTAEIDEAIAQKKRLIELLEEQKAILINQAVTKGLNPDVPMKDSGVEWIGKIPEHWEVKKMRWICSSVRDGTHNPPLAVDGEHRLLSVRNICAGKFVTRNDDRTMTEAAFQSLQRSYSLTLDDVVVALVGGTTGKSAVVKIDCSKISVQRSIGILKPRRSQILSEFLNYAIQSPSSQRRIWTIATKYAAQPGIYLDDLAQFKIICPSIQEQTKIVNYLKNVEKYFFEVITITKKQIDEINNFKCILISKVVTGRLKV